MAPSISSTCLLGLRRPTSICSPKLNKELSGPNSCSQFRPIIVLSLICRTWSSIRARQALSHLAQLMDCPAYGFLPSREAQELWVPLQGLIEVHAKRGQPSVGCVADVEKAFNHLPRDPIKQIAKHVGLGGDFVRRGTDSSLALLHASRFGTPSGRLSFPIVVTRKDAPLAASPWSSRTGATTSINPNSLRELHWHPLSTSLELVAHQPGALFQAMISQETFLNMFQLKLDRDKTYVWALTAQHRSQLQQLGHRVSRHEKDLGGQMTYGNRRRHCPWPAGHVGTSATSQNAFGMQTPCSPSSTMVKGLSQCHRRGLLGRPHCQAALGGHQGNWTWQSRG